MLKHSSLLDNAYPSGGDVNQDEVLRSLPSEQEFRAAPIPENSSCAARGGPF
jgi:hypothetical protein